MLLSNTLFDVDTILNELKAKDRGKKTALEILQIKLKAQYFDKSISNPDALNELENPVYNDFPRLKYVLQQVFSGQTTIEIPEELKDWEPSVPFEAINQKYGYFDKDLSELYKKLAIAGRKMTSLIERQAYDDEMAYKLMALFYDPNKTTEDNFKLISQKFDNLITKNQNKTIATPYHDAFVTALHNFPRFSEVQEFEKWKSFIIQYGFKSLDIFVQCAHHEAFASIEDAKSYLLQQKYPRAKENPALAQLCKQLLISNAGFEAGLEEVQTGWPKKESDNLPIVDIPDSTGTYFWVKLPPQDMRALYLGNLIPGCCQHIGGHSEQCVKDGIQLSDNGFYVLLKSKKATAHPPSRILDGQINDKDYDIVAQSYAWKTQNGNLCLDSIEWNPARVSTDNIQDLMTKFSEQVFAEHPDIKYINVGVGGQTPKDIYPNCLINETMKQGVMYMDSRTQYQIASRIPEHVLEALKERLKDLSPEYQKILLYLAPYFDDIENVPAQLMAVIDELKQNLYKLNLPPKLTTNNFRKISYEHYQTMDEAEQSGISTICKIFNSQNEEELKQWLPTIPDEELSYISLMKFNCSLEFKMAVFQRLPRIYQLATLHDLDASERSLLSQSVELFEFFKIILTHYPSDEARITALQEKDINGISALINAASHPESLKLILPLYPSRETRITALQEENEHGNSALKKACSNPESLKIILELFPETQRSQVASSLISIASSNSESLKIILELIPETQRSQIASSLIRSAKLNVESLKLILELIPKDNLFFVLTNKPDLGNSLLSYIDPKIDVLNLIFELLPKNEHLPFIKQMLKIKENRYELVKTLIDKLSKEQQVQVIKEINLSSLCPNPEGLKNILQLYPTDEERIEAFNKKRAGFNIPLLYPAILYPESLKIILEIYSTNEALLMEAILAKDDSSLTGNFPLMHALSNPESLKIMLTSIPMAKRLSSIKQTNKQGDSILSKVSSNLELLKMILELLPENDHYQALQATNIKKIEGLQIPEPKNSTTSSPSDNSQKAYSAKPAVPDNAEFLNKLERVKQLLLTNLEKNNTFSSNLKAHFGQPTATDLLQILPKQDECTIDWAVNSKLIATAMSSAISDCEGSRISHFQKEKVELLKAIKFCFNKASPADKPKLFAAFVKTASAARTNYSFSIFSSGETRSLNALRNSLTENSSLTKFIDENIIKPQSQRPSNQSRN